MKSICLYAVHLVAVFVINISYADAYNRTRRVAHGLDAEWGMFPFMALIKNNGINSPGSIIHHRYILTCTGIVKKHEKNGAKIIVRTNEIDGRHGVKYDIEDVIDYPHFTAVCLLRTTKQIIFSPIVQPIPLSSNPKVCEGCPAILVGWVHLPEKKTNKLQVARTFVARMDRCMKIWPKVREHPERYLCGEVDNNLPKACCGDYGAPFVSGGELIGVVHFSIGQDLPGYPDAYFKIAYFKNWIMNNIRP